MSNNIPLKEFITQSDIDFMKKNDIKVIKFTRGKASLEVEIKY